MVNNHKWYWFDIDHANDFIKDLDDVILFDEHNSLEKTQSEPTIFLANHTSTINIPHMHYAIQSALSNYPQNEKRMIRTISKDDNYRNERYGLIKNNIFNCWAEKSGAILVKAIDSTNPVPRERMLEPVVETLTHGSHILIYPTGSVSEDGRIDFVRQYKGEDVSTFKYRHMRLISMKVPRDIYIQTMHYTTDLVHDKFLIRMGERHRIAEMKDYNFNEEIAKCTTITGLQLYYLYVSTALDAGICPSRKDLSKKVLEFSERLHEIGYNVYNPNNTMDDAIEYVHSGKSYFLDINNKNIDTARCDYQVNQIKHLCLDESVKKFLGERKRIDCKDEQYNQNLLLKS